MLLFFESGIRGGVSQVSKRFSTANTPLIPEAYDASQPTKAHLFLDQNNLYGYAMSQPLPISGFRFLSRDEIKHLQNRLMLIEDDAEIGYALEVDLEYCTSLHDAHSDFPLAPEKLTVTEDMLSEQQRKIMQDLGCKVGKVKKLIPNLFDKKNYVLHYRNLKLYMRLGMKLKYIHRVVEFKQEKWLEPYISFNTEQRKLSNSPEEKNHFKLLNNSIYGKTMLNLRKQKDIRLVRSQKQARNLIARPNYSHFSIINEN